MSTFNAGDFVTPAFFCCATLSINKWMIAMEPTLLLQVLHVSQSMATMHVLDQLLNYVVDEAIKLMGAERGYLILVDVKGMPDFRIQRDNQGRDTQYGLDQISMTIFQQVITTHEPLVLTDACSDGHFQLAQSVQNLRLRSLLCAPLLVQGKAIGAIYVENRSLRGRFKEDKLAPLGLFANQAAVAIENAALHEALEAKVVERTASLQNALAQLQAEMAERQRVEEELRHLATFDPLTGALNRRCFYEQGEAQLILAKDERSFLSVLLFDLDRFKQVNDRHGHVAGDAILKNFAMLSRASGYGGHLFGRLGGEEFALLLPYCDEQAAATIGERICKQCANMKTIVNQQAIAVTVSIGAATVDSADLTFDTLLDRADRAMYFSKRRGGNAVTTYVRNLPTQTTLAHAHSVFTLA